MCLFFPIVPYLQKLCEESTNSSTKKRQGSENAKKGNAKKESKCSSKLTDQRFHREDEHLLLLQDIGGGKVEDELVRGQFHQDGGANPREMLISTGNLANNWSYDSGAVNWAGSPTD